MEIDWGIAAIWMGYAESEEMNLVVLGQHEHSRIARFFLGSTTDRVSEHCHCSVMIVKDGETRRS